jgi:uncharacterized membrane protein YebE (DUF533 family)
MVTRKQMYLLSFLCVSLNTYGLADIGSKVVAQIVNNKKSITALVALVAGGLATYKLYQMYEQKNKKDQTQKFKTVSRLLEQNNIC